MTLSAPASSIALVLLAGIACAKDPASGKSRAAVAAPKQESAAPASAPLLQVTPATSTIRFIGAKVTAQHPGRFNDFTGTIALADSPENSRVEFEVKMASVASDEGLDKLVGHLKSADFFDAANHPVARFTSTEIRPGSTAPDMNYTVTGNLELRGTRKSITFPAAIAVTGEAVTVRSEFAINRKDFGIVYPGMQDDLIKDNVLIQIDLRAPRPAEKS
jgi:polyisoprenoid-binding protein YceI